MINRKLEQKNYKEIGNKESNLLFLHEPRISQEKKIKADNAKKPGELFEKKNETESVSILEKLSKNTVESDAIESHQEVIKSNGDTKRSLEEIIVPEKKLENSLFGKKIIEGKSDSTSGIFSKELKSPLIPEIKVFGQKLDSYKNLGDTAADKKNLDLKTDLFENKIHVFDPPMQSKPLPKGLLETTTGVLPSFNKEETNTIFDKIEGKNQPKTIEPKFSLFNPIITKQPETSNLLFDSKSISKEEKSSNENKPTNTGTLLEGFALGSKTSVGLGLSTSSKSGSLFGGKSTFLSDTTPLISKNESKPAPSHLFGTSLWNTGMETSLFGTTTSQSNKTAAFNIGKKDAKNP